MINKRILEIRKDKKLTQNEFGKRLSVSKNVICNYENARVKPKELFLNHLCDIFNVNPDWLFNGNKPRYILPQYKTNNDSDKYDCLKTMLLKLSQLNKESVEITESIVNTLHNKKNNVSDRTERLKKLLLKFSKLNDENLSVAESVVNILYKKTKQKSPIY